jgi:hypothetical protein
MATRETIEAKYVQAADLWVPRSLKAEVERDMALTFSQYVAQYFTYGGFQYPLGTYLSSYGGTNAEAIDRQFAGFVVGAYKQNGIVFACMLARMMLFSQARFMFRQIRRGKPGDLFSLPQLDILARPWTNATTADLLARGIQDADLAGNFYGARIGNRIRRLRPDWTFIVLGSPNKPYDGLAEDIQMGSAVDVDVLGYGFQPGGPASGAPLKTFLPEEVCHFAPIPDPLASYRGMSWLEPIVREITADSAANLHKLKFFENGATSNTWVSFDPSIGKEAFDAWVQKYRENHEGVLNAYKTLFLGGGATPKVIGADFQQMDFKIVQGAGETRIAAAAGVPPVVVGLSEGLAAATYSNYGQARRHFAASTMAWLWQNMAGSMATIVPPPPGAELWYDASSIPFVQEDVKDAAEIRQMWATTMSQLINAGYEPDSVTDAVTSGDLTRLVHSGLVSVQLQPPGAQIPKPGEAQPPAALPVPASPPNGKPKPVPAKKN